MARFYISNEKSMSVVHSRVAVTSDRITNAKRFETALQLAKEHRTVTDGCAVTWDFVPRFVFRLPGCRALAVTDEPSEKRRRFPLLMQHVQCYFPVGSIFQEVRLLT